MASEWPDDMLEMCLKFYARMQAHAPDELSVMLLIAVVLFSDHGGGGGCSEFDDILAINAAQEYYTGLLEKYLKHIHGEEKGRLCFPRVRHIF